MSGTLRVLPLGGLGEIGKNMTVVELEDRIVVVDTGLRFPTAEMLGIDLVLPDFTYLRELGEIEGIAAVKQARGEEIAPIDGLDLLAGNDDDLAEVLDVGGTGGILVSSHFIGREMRRMIDEPDQRAAINDSLAGVFAAMTVTTNPIPVKAALNLLGHDVGGLRLPLVSADEEQTAAIRDALERHGLLAATR